ncbi:branched-chain amino acid ABC transporter substrate-binding protein [Paraburkholderia caballeronis]|uniref:Amino acid/amide ABC transporter substrate-binding protein, HAAT family n=1 Tax=Paraburkholderia caballeronis TaxID=416943 RepID=A0A1H7U2T4_9BURK|nr:branched-chain amino acid ABC transporter substrate-binding protein [Paraburkholderia caballeronis]PXW23484.1 amino acid/amide ABC transporter substrate-binding protein (HAAT family) [Paraburkholderia caballeronis]PXW98477.1 amino acid/amide ABC transporter substrate-binding protein (HAAT family) [Paraburkholderia caballeronis]RAJ95208.1 amino acid/amide ABC transporter substrate-binding protein (HAAT family) [Paraburkholderia caballeronis]TDV23026.1 amino acid/amide ABC transporter substrat
MSLLDVMKSAAALACAFAIGIPPASAAGPLAVRIGFVAPLSGDNARYGKDIENGARLAVEEANAQGLKIGDQAAHFDLVSEDDRADPRTGVEAAQRLTNQNVSAVVGHFNSGTTIPASRVYESAGIPMIVPAATNPLITSQGYENVFTVIPNDAQNAGAAGAYALDVLKAKRIAILDDRSAFGQGEADEFERVVRSRGGAIVVRDYAANPAGDFRPQLDKVKAADADLLFFGGLDVQAASIVKTMKAMGMRAQFVAGGGVVNRDFIQQAGAAAEGAMAWEYGRPLAALPEGQRFAQNYRNRYGVGVLAYAPFGYDAAWAAIRAMVAAKSSDPAALRAALKTIGFDGATGRIAFDERGALKNGVSTLYQVRQGAWTPVVTSGG